MEHEDHWTARMVGPGGLWPGDLFVTGGGCCAGYVWQAMHELRCQDTLTGETIKRGWNSAPIAPVYAPDKLFFIEVGGIDGELSPLPITALRGLQCWGGLRMGWLHADA